MSLCVRLLSYDEYKKRKLMKESKKVYKSITDLNTVIEKLQKKIEYLEDETELGYSRAREKKKKGDKQGAIYELRRLRQMKNSIDSLYGQMFNVEQQIAALKIALANYSIKLTLDKNNKLIKQVLDKSDAENVVNNVNETFSNVEEANKKLADQTDLAFSEDLEQELLTIEESLNKRKERSKTEKKVTKRSLSLTQSEISKDTKKEASELRRELLA